MEASVLSSVMVVWPRGAKDQHTSNVLVERGSSDPSIRHAEEQRVAVWKSARMLQQRLDRGYERYLWSTTRLGCKPCTDTEWACEKKPLWISCGAGEHFLVSLRAGNERQPSEETPLRWNRCGHRLRRGVLMENVFCGNSLGLIRCDMYWVGIGQRGT